MTVTMATPRRLEVRVVASDDGKPVPDVRVGSGAGTLATGVSSDGMTDAEGKAALHLPAGRYRYLSADPTSVDSRYLRTYLRPLVVTADSAVQPIELKMRVGAELLIEVVDADTGQGIPNVLLDINPGSPGGGWSRLWKSSVFFTPGTPTDAAGQVRAVLDPQPGVTYRVRVAGVGLETAVDPRDLGAPPPPITSGPEAREIPYEAVNAMSGPFEPKAGTPTRLRFTLRKKK